MDAPRDWNDFHAFLMKVYWPALPPAERIVSRPVPMEAKGEAGVVPDAIWQAAVLMFPDPEAWLHNPIPNLGGRTPLDVLAAGERDKIKEILVEVGPFMLPDPDEMKAWDA